MDSVVGSQSLRRGLRLLAWLGMAQADGVRLKELVAASGLERSTAYRLVAALVDEGFVERDPHTKIYYLGLQAMQLGLSAVKRAPLVDKCRPAMLRLARSTGDTVFLMLRQNDHALCLHREEGDFPIKALATDVGRRRLLGLGAAGRAILARMPDPEVSAIFTRHREEFELHQVDAGALRMDVRESRRRGYSAMRDTITTGLAGVGCSFVPSPNILAGISIGAIDARMDPARQRELGELIAQECAALTTRPTQKI